MSSVLNAQISKIDSLENLLQKHTKEDTTRVNLLNEIALNYLKTNNGEEVLKYVEKAQKLALKISFKKGKAKSLKITGEYYRTKANYNKATEYYKKSLKIAEEIGNLKIIAKNINNIGIIYYYKGDYSSAIKYYQESLNLKEELGDKKGISTNLHNSRSHL